MDTNSLGHLDERPCDGEVRETRNVTIVRRRRRERGAVLLIFALPIVLLVGVVAIALDLGRPETPSPERIGLRRHRRIPATQQPQHVQRGRNYTQHGTDGRPGPDVVNDNAPNIGTS